MSHQKKDHAKIQEIQRALDFTRDELAAWAAHLQQQQQLTPRGAVSGSHHSDKGDVKIEVTDPSYLAGKFIVLQESLIYLVQGKGSLILERHLCRDFQAGTPVRLLNDTDQCRTEDNGGIYLQNPYQSHHPMRNRDTLLVPLNPIPTHEGQGNLGNSHGQNGDVGSPGHIELDGQGKPPLQWTTMEVNHNDRLPCGKPKPPVERAEVPVGDLTLTTWLLRSQFQQARNSGVDVMNTIYLSVHTCPIGL